MSNSDTLQKVMGIMAAGAPGCAAPCDVTEARPRERVEIREPRQFKVLLHNDDITTMDFVVGVLCRVFHKQPEEAEAIMLNVHNTGIGLCGIYTQEIAATKVRLVRYEARVAGYPLKCTMEEE